MNDPLTIQETAIRKAATWKKIFWVSAGGIILPPLFGLGGTVIATIRAFDTMGISG